MDDRKNREPLPINVEQAPGVIPELYLDAAAQEAVARVGAGPQLKGTIHEVMFRDGRNLSADGLMNGKTFKLTASTNARAVDVVAIKDGRVAGRFQLKDVTSKSGISDVAKRVERGDYRSAKLVGTEETSANYKAHGGDKPMQSSNVSSTRTTRAADNAGADVPNKDLLKNNLQDIGKCSVAAVGVGAAVGALVEAKRSWSEYSDGQIDGLDYAGRIGKSAAETGVGAGARTVVALGVKEASKQIAARAGLEAVRRVAGSNVGTAVAFTAVEQAWDTVRLARGQIDVSQYGEKTVQNAGSSGGALGGALGGAAIGTALFPGVGTAIGGLIGGIGGGISGSLAGGWLGKKLFGR